MASLLLNGTTSLAYAPPPLIPIPPDYSICDRRYGSHLMPLLCGWAAETLTQGDSPISYTVSGSGATGPHNLPHTAIFGNCKIWVEVAGPTIPRTYIATPDEIRGMAAEVIDQCVGGGGGGMGYGGFATKDISKLTGYVTEPDTQIRGTYPASSAFLTVTVTGPRDQTSLSPSPGNYDPSVGLLLAEKEVDAWNKAPSGSPLRRDLAWRQQFFTRQSMRMQTGGTSITWWGSKPRAAISET